MRWGDLKTRDVVLRDRVGAVGVGKRGCTRIASINRPSSPTRIEDGSARGAGIARSSTGIRVAARGARRAWLTWRAGRARVCVGDARQTDAQHESGQGAEDLAAVHL